MKFQEKKPDPPSKQAAHVVDNNHNLTRYR